METASWEEKLTQWPLSKRAICEGEDFKHGMRTACVSDNHKLNITILQKHPTKFWIWVLLFACMF